METPRWEAETGWVTCLVCDRHFDPGETNLIMPLGGFEDAGICHACLAQEREGWITLGDLCGEEGEE